MGLAGQRLSEHLLGVHDRDPQRARRPAGETGQRAVVVAGAMAEAHPRSVRGQGRDQQERRRPRQCGEPISQRGPGGGQQPVPIGLERCRRRPRHPFHSAAREGSRDDDALAAVPGLFQARAHVGLPVYGEVPRKQPRRRCAERRSQLVESDRDPLSGRAVERSRPLLPQVLAQHCLVHGISVARRSRCTHRGSAHAEVTSGEAPLGSWCIIGAMDTFREFVDEVLGPASMLPALEVPITDGIGCRAAADVVADRPVPGFRQASVEGIAVSRADAPGASPATPAVLPIGGALQAGEPAEPLPEGHCATIAIGAPVPPGADAVVGPDGYRFDGDKVLLARVPPVGEGIRDVGAVFAEGETILARGQRLGTIVVAELALAGFPRVRVHPRPRVVIVTVGSELVRASGTAGDVSVHDATGVLLTTSAVPLGATCHRVGPVPDDPRVVRDTLEDQLVRADIIVTAGGIDSPDDVVRQELHHSGVARFDGPPLAPCNAYGIGLLGPERTPVIALPGDPAAALLAFHALVRPVIDAMLGRHEEYHEVVLPPWHAAAGSRIIPGRFEHPRFVPLAEGSISLRQLEAANAIAIQHRGINTAGVVVWPN
jgi:molybdopterin molybdotransferase